MGKGGGSSKTPHEAPDDLKSSQVLTIVDAICEGPIEGPVDGLKSVRINKTPVLDRDGNAMVHGVTVVYRVGEDEQTAMEGFEDSGAETLLGVEVKKSEPVTRTITAKTLDRLRFTFGVQSLVSTSTKGDRNPTSIQMLIQFRRDGLWRTERDITITGKTTTQFLASVVIDDLPPRPFEVRMLRITDDSTTDLLQNKTVWSGYTEIIDVKQRYPNTAVIGVKVDAEQFGSQQVTRNYLLRGRIVPVPSNYDPVKRTYMGIWDGTFKPAWTDNPAWCVLDMLTHPRYGMGSRIGVADVDKWALYAIAQYCDQSVPDGFGGTEPRITCNAYLTDQRKAWDVLGDFCSLMRCMPVWNGSKLTFVQDRPADKAWTYTQSNVVMPADGAPFVYSFSALKERHNAAEVRYTDPNNGWETSTELVENDAAIRRYGRNVLKMDAFACTSRGQAHRAGLWAITTELLETQTVDFSVGAEGLRHVPGDIIEVCDSDYAGVTVGGRVLSVDSLSRMLTLDREVEIPAGGNVVLNLVGSDGQPVTVAVTAHPAPDRVTVSQLPDGVAAYSVWGLKLPDLRQRLFRCVAIRENDDGTYAITAVQHVPEKESIVDNGAKFDPLPGTSITNTPPAVQHLTTEILAEEGQYQARARWDTPRVVKGVNFSLRLTVKAEDDSDRLASNLTLTETEHTFRNLTPGRYTLTVRAVNSQGQQGDPASTQFSIAAPEAPSFIELTPGYFQITATPRQAVHDPTVQYEFWFSDAQITDIHQVENAARYLGTALYWIAASVNIRPGRDYYFYIRAVNQVGKSAFVEATGQASNDAAGYLDFFKGQITESHLGKELLEKVDLTEDNASKLQQFSKEWQDANDKWNAMWGVKIEQTKDGKYYVAGLGLSMEDTPDGKISQFLVAADRIAYINPANGNETPGFVMQGDQIIMNEAFLKYLSAPTITSGGNPPAFSLTPDGKLTAKNADISGHINAVSGSFTGEINATSGKFSGVIEAREFVGDICGSKVMQGVSIRATNDERSTSTRYTD
ncbi:host specificity protein J, partial [Salmonella enterica subsp. enterica serovar Montevideo]|nr:host specificity protein J [Salmonella enterica subsp. enterica serovar Enteritidis]EGS4938898.1 host specificity protein J [Salmonella enterica subsp. enterica serovar Montevideo]MJR77521.1 host specificity protein J [Salmonella enterica subsp. enterica serovar Enteritidis]